MKLWLLRSGSKWVICTRDNTALQSFKTKKAAKKYAAEKGYILHDGY